MNWRIMAKRDSVEYLLDVIGPAAQDRSRRNADRLSAKYPLDTGRLAQRDRTRGRAVRLGEEETGQRAARLGLPRIGAF